jgi:hypothetical protein
MCWDLVRSGARAALVLLAVFAFVHAAFGRRAGELSVQSEKNRFLSLHRYGALSVTTRPYAPSAVEWSLAGLGLVAAAFGAAALLRQRGPPSLSAPIFVAYDLADVRSLRGREAGRAAVATRAVRALVRRRCPRSAPCGGRGATEPLTVAGPDVPQMELRSAPDDHEASTPLR